MHLSSMRYGLVYGCLLGDLALRLLHSAKLPEYIPHVFSLGEIVRIRSGQIISTMGRLRANVGTKIAKACMGMNSWGKIVYCQRM